MLPDLPEQLGRYWPRSRLGSGGMADVFRAELRGAQGFRKEVALKILKTQPGERACRMMDWFVREGRLGGLLRHPNIVDVYEFGEDQDYRFIAMELLEGEDLSQLSARTGPLPIHMVLRIGDSVSRALEAAHGLVVDGVPTPVIHRDIKPANIFLDKYGTVKVLDYGIAWLGAGDDQIICGTPEYMAPEQANRAGVDGRSDLFSLGVVLYDLLVGDLLFDRRKRRDRLTSSNVDAIVNVPAVWLPFESRCPALIPILKRCIQSDPNKRFPSAAAFREALNGIQNQTEAPVELRKLLVRAPIGSDDSQSYDTLDGSFDTITPPTTDSLPGLTNLRRSLDRYIGRAEVASRLSEQLQQPGMITLMGHGGMGKTRLAKEVGLSQLDHFPGGVWFCDLVEARSRHDVMLAIAKALSIVSTAEDDAGLVQEMSRLIQRRGRALLILDNAEQVTEPVRHLLEAWLPEWTSTSILVTSREPIGLSGERPWRLEPLTIEEAMALFRDRAQNPPGPNEDGVLAEVVGELDCLPLAIELAARRTTVMSVSALRKRLHDRFKLLRLPGAGNRRHGTLEAVIGSSWEALTEWQRDALAQCAVFRGGFTLEAAEEIIDLSAHPEAPWTVDALEALVDKSLVFVSATKNGRRLHLMVSVQAFASQALESRGPEFVKAAHGRHAQYYGGPEALAADENLPEQAALLRAVTELDNLVVAMDRAITEGWPVEAVRACQQALRVYWDHGPNLKAMDLLQQVEGCVEGDVDAQQWWLMGFGLVLRRLGRYNESTAQYERALAVAKASHNVRNHARVLNRLGNLAGDCGNHETAMIHYQQALDIARGAGCRDVEGIALGNLGLLYKTLGDLTKSEEAQLQALNIAIEVGDQRSTARNRINLAALCLSCDRREEAFEGFKRGYVEAKALGIRRLEAGATEGLGVLSLKRGDLGPAQEYLGQALALQRAIGDRAKEAVVGVQLGLLKTKQGRMAESVEYLETSIALFREIGAANWMTYAMGRLAEAKHALGDSDAVPMLQEAIRHSDEMGDGLMADAFREILVKWTPVGSNDPT